MTFPESIPPLGAESSWRDFLRGASAPFSAARLIVRSPRLRWLSALCAVVTAVSLVALVWVLSRWTGAWVARWVAEPQSLGLKILWDVLVALTFAVMLVAGMNTVPLLALAPLQDSLSAAADAAVGGAIAQPFSFARAVGNSARSFGHTLSRLALLWSGHAVLLLLNFIPLAGHAAWLGASILWTMGWLAVEYLDAPMTRRGYGFRHVRRLVGKRLAASLGFGAALYVLLWIPVFNFFLIPFAVVGGTLLLRGLDAAGALES